MDIKTVVCNAYRSAKLKKGLSHRELSERFVDCLAEQLKESLDASVRVLSKRNKDNREHFGMNEMLHDIVAFSENLTASRQGDTCMHYVQDPLWQVESEFDERDYHVVRDFNKLILGSAPQRLFVASRRKDHDNFRRMLAPLAAACRCEVYLAIIPHPRFWEKDSDDPVVLCFHPNSRDWVELTS